HSGIGIADAVGNLRLRDLGLVFVETEQNVKLNLNTMFSIKFSLRKESATTDTRSIVRD
ncbi:hypothetical protein NW766_011598, partial [Fusarium irregulare]